MDKDLENGEKDMPESIHSSVVGTSESMKEAEIEAQKLEIENKKMEERIMMMNVFQLLD